MEKKARLEMLEIRLDNYKYADRLHSGDRDDMAELRREISRLKQEIIDERNSAILTATNYEE